MLGTKLGRLARSTSGAQDCALTGITLLQSPSFNKGSAFSEEEREKFGLVGLLPSRINNLEEQTKRAYEQYLAHTTMLDKNTFMTSLKDQNEVLFYRLVQEHLKETFPVIYTPTEGDAIANYSKLFRRPRGCFLNISDPERIEEGLDQWGPSEDIDIIACSDGEQILGIGDQGVGGILISVAKLVIYTLCAGIHPNRTLPVVLDVGTDNPELLNSPRYLGLQRPRIRGEEYDRFIDRFIWACRKRFPRAYIHFEDFGLHNARRILDKYMGEIACFNDDVQGTGCVTLAALYAACHVAGYQLQDLRVVMFGAGSAGTGIADQIRDAIALEGHKSREQAARQIWCIDKQGMLLQSDGDDLTPAQVGYARPDSEWQGVSQRSLLEVIRHVKPQVLIGTSTKPKAFTKDVVEEMTRHVPRPCIFPLSNPTRLHEADPKDLIEWTDGKVLTATGSPFPPVKIRGTWRVIAECNNSTTFPGIGLGAVLSRTRLLTPAMLVAATKTLAAQAPSQKDPEAGLLPDVSNVREVSVRIAAAVIKQAVKDGLAQEDGIPDNDQDLDRWIKEQMWDAKYRPLNKVDKSTVSKAV